MVRDNGFMVFRDYQRMYIQENKNEFSWFRYKYFQIDGYIRYYERGNILSKWRCICWFLI